MLQVMFSLRRRQREASPCARALLQNPTVCVEQVQFPPPSRSHLCQKYYSGERLFRPPRVLFPSSLNQPYEYTLHGLLRHIQQKEQRFPVASAHTIPYRFLASRRMYDR